MKLIALFIIVLCPSWVTAQQSYSIKGAVTDTMATYKLVNTTVTVLNQKDSTLVKFSRTNADGDFSIHKLRPGKFILLLSYPGYADYAEEFTLDSTRTVKDFGRRNMILKATLLQDVIIKGKAAAIKIKGDTTEFNAGSYNIEPNAKVEDLLKQLPGIQIDKDGKITAQGQTVNKVLVDGEEFFGDDPTLVTKNIRGDMVDKVQLYDKKSDQATFTGIDDGKTAKTINIKLKEDKKNGYFGKAEAGLGTDKFYTGKAMFNAFKAKQKFSAYGITGNTGQTGLGWAEQEKFGTSNLEVSDDGGLYFAGSRDDIESYDGRYNGQGIPLVRNGGLHYENKWNSDQRAINTNYKIGSIAVEGEKENLVQNNLPSGLINSSSNQQFDNFMFRQKLDVTYTVILDTTATLKLSANGTQKNSKTSDNFTSLSSREDNSLLNTGSRMLSNDGDQLLFNATALWTKKLKKKGRTLSLNLSESINKNESSGFLNSTNEFFNEQGGRDSIQTINQYKTNKVTSTVFNSNMVYTEPITKRISLALNYGLGINNSSSNRQSFNQNAAGQYDLPDMQFSNDFSLDQLSNQGGATFNYKQDKTSITAGTKISHVDFKQFDAYTDKTFSRTFINWNPQFSYQYRFSQRKSFWMSYNGNTTQPNIDQIQPIRVNTDPLNITLGNPNLKPSFRSNLYTSYSSYKILSDQYIYIGGGFTMTNNPIVNNTTTDAAGKNTYQAINLGDKTPYNINFSTRFSRKIKSLDLNVGINLSLYGNVNYNMVSNEVQTALNTSKSYSYSSGLNLSKYKEKKYSLWISAGPSYNTITSSLQTRTNNKGLGFQGDGNFNLILPGKVEINTDANYQYTAKTQTFDEDLERLIWNASITKKFFKAENLKFVLSGNDLLNQNVGFSRFANNNMITQNSYTTIQRYFMCSVVWDFSKMGGAAPKK